METISIPELIIKKRDAKELSEAEVHAFVKNVASGGVNTAQAGKGWDEEEKTSYYYTAVETEFREIGAMLMAMYLRGLSLAETEQLTRAMMESGEILTWPERWRHLVVDKHSTGGVGDKISLVLAPALAACGLKVPMISGRGLGYTGGTLDKLESIPGYCVMRTQQEILEQLETVGCCIVGQTDRLVPADKVLYAIRDTTGTVDNMSLVTASILSKKAAESVKSLVMEVTVGKGAPFNEDEKARHLAQMLINSGRALGINTTAMLFRMDDPLGHMIGNSLEVVESVECLQGQGPADLEYCVCRMGGQLLLDTKLVSSLDEGHERIRQSLHDGAAQRTFIDMVMAQGAQKEDAHGLFVPEQREKILPKAKYTTEFTAPTSGYIHNIDALCCAMLAHRLGAGRQRPGDVINYAVGLQLRTYAGEQIHKGDIWLVVHHDAPLTHDQRELAQSALIVGDQAPSLERLKRIFDILT